MTDAVAVACILALVGNCCMHSSIIGCLYCQDRTNIGADWLGIPERSARCVNGRLWSVDPTHEQELKNSKLESHVQKEPSFRTTDFLRHINRTFLELNNFKKADFRKFFKKILRSLFFLRILSLFETLFILVYFSLRKNAGWLILAG